MDIKEIDLRFLQVRTETMTQGHNIFTHVIENNYKIAIQNKVEHSKKQQNNTY